MKFLKKVILKKEFCNIKPCTINFQEGLNVIVGENGSGKSSLLKLITGENFKETRKLFVEPQTTFRFLDTEKDNPRIKNNIEHSKNIGFDLNARFVSHGEAMLPLILASQDFKDILLIVDEPEAGISISNQKKIVEAFKKVVENGCQIILTTHSYVIINSVDKIFSMDKLQWIKSKEFLKS